MPKAGRRRGAVDRETKRWVKNPSDERAAANGCRFDEGRGRFVVDWVERYCRLYEGDGYAGRPLVMADWQLECTMRLFGWVKWSEKWQREVRRFREASLWLAKKNAKTPTLAAWALYLLCGDGEPGQKVFLAAKDGQQVRENLARHVVEMLKRSPELLSECKINESTKQVTHLPSSSIITTLSSSNERTQESKEGLNGCVLVDETHVVDRELMARVSRAGISRSEPLQIEVSTAGNNPDGYGKQRFDHALEVQEGRRDDERLFAAVYAAPQQLSDADLEADPLKYGRMANPAMGRIVDPEEYLDDYRRSRAAGLYEFGLFKMYRGNIWQRSASPWLREADWEACREDFTPDGLEGQECWAGLDLSKTQDMTALVLCFRGEREEEYRLLPFFWLPEEAARANDSAAPFLTWAAQGHLELTPGNVLDYGFVKARFRRLAQTYRIRKLSYDPKYAEEVTQSLEQDVVDDTGATVEEGTGVEREAFPQTLGAFCGPTADFERLVLAGRLRHNGHPVLAWQAGHVQVRPDANNNKRPVKPPGSDPKKIDGIVAGIMALAAAMASATPEPMVYVS